MGPFADELCRAERGPCRVEGMLTDEKTDVKAKCQADGDRHQQKSPRAEGFALAQFRPVEAERGVSGQLSPGRYAGGWAWL